jgi:hypothetical protein
MEKNVINQSCLCVVNSLQHSRQRWNERESKTGFSFPLWLLSASVALLYPFHFNVYLSRPPSNQTPSCTNNAHQKYIAMPRVFSHTFNFNTQPWFISTHTHSHFLSAAHIHCVLLGRKEFKYHLVVGSEKTQKISQPWWPRDWSQEWVVHLH